MQRGHRSRGLYWLAVLASLVLLVGGGLVAYSGFSAASGPQGVVRGYFAAVQRGDAAGALSYGDLPAGPHSLLTDTALGAQRRAAEIRHVAIVSVTRPRADRALVSVRYELDFASGPRQVNDRVPLRRRDSSWRLVRTAIPATIELSGAQDRASVAGAPVPTGRTLMFPGAVPIHLDTPYLQVRSGAVRFTTTGRTVSVGIGVSAAGKTAVARELKTKLKRCLGSGGAGACPLPSTRYVPGSLQGRLIDKPVKRMALSVGTAAAGVIEIAGTVRFRGSFHTLNFDNVAVRGHGTIRLPLSAVGYAVTPLSLQWTARA